MEGLKTSPHETNSAGSQRYKCFSCNKTWVDNLKNAGAKPIGDRAMTKSERNRKRYQQNKEKFKMTNSNSFHKNDTVNAIIWESRHCPESLDSKKNITYSFASEWWQKWTGESLSKGKFNRLFS